LTLQAGSYSRQSTALSKQICPNSLSTGIMSGIVNNKPDVPPTRYRTVVSDIYGNSMGRTLGGHCWLERHNE
jgi:hypothetical protein